MVRKQRIYEKDNALFKGGVISTKIDNHYTELGKNVRISKKYTNNTTSNIKKTIQGTHTWEVKLNEGVGIDINKVISAINAKLDVSVAYSKTFSDTTTVIIKPRETFYITYTPKYVVAKGKQLVNYSHGHHAWKNFKVSAPKLLNTGELDGTVYYVCKKG